jgi:hypothetical protein
VRCITAVMLRDNQGMQRTCQKLGFQLHYVPQDQVMVARLELSSPRKRGGAFHSCPALGVDEGDPASRLRGSERVVEPIIRVRNQGRSKSPEQRRVLGMFAAVIVFVRLATVATNGGMSLAGTTLKSSAVQRSVRQLRHLCRPDAPDSSCRVGPGNFTPSLSQIRT